MNIKNVTLAEALYIYLKIKNWDDISDILGDNGIYGVRIMKIMDWKGNYIIILPIRSESDETQKLTLESMQKLSKCYDEVPYEQIDQDVREIQNALNICKNELENSDK